MMELELLRFSTSLDDTIGLLSERIPGESGCRFLCFTLEDEKRKKKVRGETRIPAGRYRIVLRREGKLHERYAEMFPDIHRGMLHLLDVPEFTFIYLHVGNDEKDTDGCILVGDTVRQNVTVSGFLGGSKFAYARIYPPIAKAIESGEEVWISVRDIG